jgi:hypothetical protein
MESMLFLLAYLAVAAAFYLACARELGRARTRERVPRDTADHFILHLVAVLAAICWVVSLPVLVRAGIRWLRPWRALSAGVARVAARLPFRRTRLAG